MLCLCYATVHTAVLAPLTHLTSANVKFKWTNVEQMAFNKIKQIVRHEMLLSYPVFNQPFEIYTENSHTQLGAVINCLLLKETSTGSKAIYNY